jgi:hypothetical protein
MHCHVCDEHVPLPEVLDHVRLFHPDATPEELPRGGWLGASVSYVIIDEAF